MNQNGKNSQTDKIDWLLERSMLRRSEEIGTGYSGTGRLWRRPYAEAQPRAATASASVWLAVYPASIVTRAGESVLRTLGDDALWETLAAIGIDGLHTGPMKRAGGVRPGKSGSWEFTSTIDGHFDRIMLEIDPDYGTLDDYLRMSAHARAVGAVIIGDIIPGHTGKGPDFRLAERAYGDYPGAYHMVAIDQVDWPLLPDVPEGRDSVNLPPATVDALRKKGYIVGRLSRVIFYEPGVKESNWSATGAVRGVDGVERRWVYLHYFKEGQPSLNWLDPSFAAQRLLIGDALHSLGTLGVGMLRLDANGFLGVEPREEGPAWSEGHPLSITGNQIIGGMVRKAGGFTFQELNLTVDDIAAMSRGGADLSYDFITRPAYHHALVTGDAEFLRLMLRTTHEYDIDPASLIHALQNHDELTLELVHFWTLHSRDRYTFQGEDLSGAQLRERIRAVMYGRLTGEGAPYNQPFVTNGVACTTASVIAAALGIRDLAALSPEDVARIRRVHLLLAMFNAFQPGVFALSGWDLVGALPLPLDAVRDLIADGDTRWINRGGYDLMGAVPGATRSSSGLPMARALYGSLPDQLARPDSFVSQLQRLLAVRRAYRLYAARQIDIPDVESPGLLVMVHGLADGLGVQVTALNFGPQPVKESVAIPVAGPGQVVEMITGRVEGALSADGRLSITLAGYDGKSLLCSGAESLS
jgi:trehalose synthase